MTSISLWFEKRVVKVETRKKISAMLNDLCRRADDNMLSVLEIRYVDVRPLSNYHRLKMFRFRDFSSLRIYVGRIGCGVWCEPECEDPFKLLVPWRLRLRLWRALCKMFATRKRDDQLRAKERVRKRRQEKIEKVLGGYFD